MKTKVNTKSLVILGLMTALTMIFSFTPIGSIPIGPLVITLNVIPIAIAAVTVGPVGSAVIGGVFGLLSFLQCFGIGVPSGMGAALVAIDPVLAFVQRFVPRLLDGIIVGFIAKGMSKVTNNYVSYAVTGFLLRFEHCVLYECTCFAFRQHRLCKRAYGRKEYHSIHLHLCRHKRSGRNGCMYICYRYSGCCTL